MPYLLRGKNPGTQVAACAFVRLSSPSAGPLEVAVYQLICCPLRSSFIHPPRSPYARRGCRLLAEVIVCPPKVAVHSPRSPSDRPQSPFTCPPRLPSACRGCCLPPPTRTPLSVALDGLVGIKRGSRGEHSGSDVHS
jgi:hypothetical protein